MSKRSIEAFLVGVGTLSLIGSGLISFAVYDSKDPCGLQYIVLGPALLLALVAALVWFSAANLARDRLQLGLAWGNVGLTFVAIFVALHITDEVGIVLASVVLILTGVGLAIRIAQATIEL
jgi:apolipoprotein N-acyltransferase